MRSRRSPAKADRVTPTVIVDCSPTTPRLRHVLSVRILLLGDYRARYYPCGALVDMLATRRACHAVSQVGLRLRLNTF